MRNESLAQAQHTHRLHCVKYAKTPRPFIVISCQFHGRNKKTALFCRSWSIDKWTAQTQTHVTCAQIEERERENKKPTYGTVEGKKLIDLNYIYITCDENRAPKFQWLKPIWATQFDGYFSVLYKIFTAEKQPVYQQ